MNNVRVGGVCMLLLIVAAALPFDVCAQTPETATDSGSESAPSQAIGGAAISKDFLSQGSGANGIVSTENIKKRSSSLRPALASEGSSETDTGASATETEDASTANQDLANQAEETQDQAPVQMVPISSESLEAEVTASPSQEEDAGEEVVDEQDAGEPVTEAVGNPVEDTSEAVGEAAETEPVATEPVVAITPDQIEEQSSVIQPVVESVASSETLNSTPEIAGPDENVTAESAVAENETSSQNQTAANETALDNETVEEETAAEVEDIDIVEEFPNRVWREGDPLQYIWDYNTFSGFFYDFEDNLGTERLEVNLHKSGSDTSRTIDSDDLTYRTQVKSLDYEFGDWGSYQVVGFMAEKYFAGYSGTNPDVVDNEASLINEGQLRRVLIDSDEENSISSGSALSLEEGYELRIKEIDINGNKVYIALAEDGDEIDSKVVSPDGAGSSTYKYEVDVGGKDVPIIMAHIQNVFRGTETDLVTVDGIFQLADTYASVEEGDKYGEMEVDTVSDTEITMTNEDTMTLRKGSVRNIFGNVGFLVADSDSLRFAPTVERTGTFEVRGTVVVPESGMEFTWNPYNFEGFYYDIDDDIGTENLTAKITGIKIDDGDLLYETRPQSVSFEFNKWGKYDVIGFMADKFFAGYNDDTEFTDPFSIISEGELRRVLMDSDDDQTIATGSVLPLEEGYELRIKQVDINGNKVYLALAKDGSEVDSKVVTPSSSIDTSSNYLYKVDIGGEDVPIIAAHVQSVFRGTEADLATVDGIFQVSDSPESVEEGEAHGKMKVESLSDDGIEMQNDGSISLSRGKTVSIMDNLMFVVADNDIRNFAPVALKSVGGKPISINISEAVLDQTVKITVKSGSDAVNGAQVIVAGSTIGNTDASGSISYTPRTIGTFEVIAKKTGFDEGRASMQVMSSVAAARMARASEAMANVLAIAAPSEVLKGENFVITVTTGLNQTPVEGANLSFDGQDIGTTGAVGTLTYAANATGDSIIRAEKEGFEAATRKVTVASPVEVVGLQAPETAGTGQNVKVVANIHNLGSEPDSRTLEFKVNDEVVETREVTVPPGENATETFSYKPAEVGTYQVSVDGQSSTISVEKSQNNWALIALILVLLIAIGAGAYLYKTGELESLKKRLEGR
ncbi:MAG: S-layer protein [Methanotrichaceae archaeon]|nr:S-layer protein [Methanotrichaceae archaeon]